MSSYERVTKHIPAGRENAITRCRLSELTGMSDRANRRYIEAARKAGIKIINEERGKGYYIAENDDEWLIFLERHRKKAMSELAIYNEGIKLLPNNYAVAQIVPVRAHIRYIKGDQPPFDGQMRLDI